MIISMSNVVIFSVLLRMETVQKMINMNLKNDQILMVLNYLISVLMVFISSVFFLIFSTQLMLRKYENKEVQFIIQEL